jgi:hypothetical protein
MRREMLLLSASLGVVFLLQSGCSSFSEDREEGDRDQEHVGGSCDYQKYAGTCTITKVASTDVEYSFVPDDATGVPDRLNPYRGMSAAAYLGLDCLSGSHDPGPADLTACGVEVNARFACELSEITSGTCAPIGVDFGERIVGGDCEYEIYNGICTITNVDADSGVVDYQFSPAGPVPFDGYSGSVAAAYLGLDCLDDPDATLESCDVRVDGAFVCELFVETRGACVPIVVDFADRRTAGGPCSYETYAGACTITKVESTLVEYSFTSSDAEVPDILKNGRVAAAYLGLDCLSGPHDPTPTQVARCGITVGETFACAVSIRTSGSCSPTGVEFLDPSSCAGEGEYQSATMDRFYAECCAGLSQYETLPSLPGAEQLCYDPQKGTPVCKGSSAPSGEGWYYANDSLVRSESCPN